MKKLEKIRQKLGETSKRLSDLDEKHKALDAIVERAKAYKVRSVFVADSMRIGNSLMLILFIGFL